jgi:hypothetical protein
VLGEIFGIMPGRFVSRGEKPWKILLAKPSGPIYNTNTGIARFQCRYLKFFQTSFLPRSNREWFYHVGPDYCSSEWLEIDLSSCDQERVQTALREIGAPFEESAQFLRVIGYKQ